jgi:hypothetical protein
MVGGKWLYLGTTAELDEGIYRKFGFLPLRRAVWAPYDRLIMLRTPPGTPEDPLATASGRFAVRDLTRADWPAMVTMLQYREGPDPRVPLEESAVTAEVFTLDLLDHLEQGKSVLKGSWHGDRLVGIGMVAIDQPGKRTYAMLMPHTDAPPVLREALVNSAKAREYERVDFPMELLAQHPAGVTDTPGEESDAGPAPEPPAQSAADEPPPVA